MPSEPKPSTARQAFPPIPPASPGPLASIPFPERSVPAVTARHVVDIPMEGVEPGDNILEGLAFGHDGMFYLCCTPMGSIWRVNVDTQEVGLWQKLPLNMIPSAIKFHQDGRLFVTCVSSDRGSCVAVLSPDGELLDTLAETHEHLYNDLVFDLDDMTRTEGVELISGSGPQGDLP